MSTPTFVYARPTPSHTARSRSDCSETRRLSLELAEPLSRRGHDRPAHGRCQPDQVAPRSRHLVLRDLHPRQAPARLRGVRRRPSTTASTPITRARARGSRARKRGVLTRPSAERVLAYRAHVDEALARLLARGVGPASEITRLIEVGINHEQQHQELLLTDILALFAANPLRPAYRPRRPARRRRRARGASTGSISPAASARSATTATASPGTTKRPRHDVLMHPFRLADRLVTNGEWLRVHGRRRLPHAVAVAVRRLDAPSIAKAGSAPLYWEERDGAWLAMSLEGLQPVDPPRPSPRQLLRGRRLRALGRQASADRVRVGGRRAPTWPLARQFARPPARSAAAARIAADGRRGRCSATSGNGPRAPTCPIRAIAPAAPARSASTTASSWSASRCCAAAPAPRPRGHTRATYRNFFYPHQRWQFIGPAPCLGDCVMLSPTCGSFWLQRYRARPTTSSRSRARRLSRPQKTLPCRYFYDARGSELFEEITRLPEYYPTRTETAILEAHARRDGRRRARRRRSGRVRLRLQPQDRDPARRAAAARAPTSPIDVSASALRTPRSARGALSRARCRAHRAPTSPIPSRCPPTSAGGTSTGFFPGSTIGNLTPVEARRAAARISRAVLSPGGRLIVGVDLKKDPRTLRARLQRRRRRHGGLQSQPARPHQSRARRRLRSRRLPARGDLQPRDGRIEMHLVSRRDQDVRSAAAASTSATARPSTPRTPTSTRCASFRISRAPRIGAHARLDRPRPSASACMS